jgi:hypothetical protein
MNDYELFQNYAGKKIFESDPENPVGLRATLGKVKEDCLYIWTSDYHLTHLSKEEALRLAEAILRYINGP